MAEGNGASAPTEYTVFMIGKKEVKVSALTLYVLESRQKELDFLGPDLSRTVYVRNVLKIIAFILDEDNAAIKEIELGKQLIIGEFDGIIQQFGALLRMSGFEPPGEALAAVENDGTGTSELSSPNLPLTGFAPETSTGSNDPIH